MFNIFETSFYELICQLVKNDYGDTFSSELEKDFFLCMLKHFFTIHDGNDFYMLDISSETYDEFYRGTLKSYYWDMSMDDLQEFLDNQKENAHETY